MTNEKHLPLYQHRFKCLLGTLLLLMLVVPTFRLLGSEAQVPLIAISSAYSVVLLAAVFAVSRDRRTVWLAGTLAAVAILFHGLSVLLRHDGIFASRQLLSIVLLGYVVLMLLRYLFAPQRVTMDTIAASLCVYLLLGVLWALAYSLLDTLALDSFSIQFDRQHSGEELYFSYVTLTTLGYGDITPTSMAARMLTTIEAIIGQIYLAVLVARLVGLHIAHASDDKMN